MNLNQLTLLDSLNGLKTGKFTSVELTQACLDQIKKTDKSYNAFLTINQQALDQAKAADQKISKSKSAFDTQPLLGIPYALKDNFLTKDLRTTASSKVLDSFIPPVNASVVDKLDAAGAIILGKTNMDAWAHGSSTETSDYGPTKNPWNTDHLPGGSSGGSAAAAIADQCIFAIGSETAGSIRQPASWCGITGFKPTYGRVSRYGVVSMASSTDSPGPIAKTVADCALITQIIAGTDPKDATTSPTAVDFSQNQLAKASLKGVTIGVPQEYLLEDMDQQVLSVVQSAIDEFKSAGATIKPISLMDPHLSIGVYTIVQRSEVSSNLARYHGVRYSAPRSQFGSEAKRRIMLGTFALSSGYYDQYYNKAQQVRTLIIEDFHRAFKEVDLILGPVSPTTALKLGASQDQAMFGELQDVLVEASSIAGLTGLSVPCGFVDGLPVGLQITGNQLAENQVLKAGHAYQQATNWHTQKPNLKS